MNHRQMTLWPTSRRGSVLPWFAVSLFVLLPLAALVIDMSLVRLTRRQMQSAVNSAALEGLRQRNSGMSVPEREDLSELIVESCFGGDPYQFGIGPAIGFAGGTDVGSATGFRAGAQIVLADPTGVHRPHLSIEFPDVGANSWEVRTSLMVPYIFARSAATQGETGIATYAVGRAEAHMARRVGVPSSEIEVGIADCWLKCDAWAGLSDGATVTVNPSGEVLDTSMAIIGQFRTDDTVAPSPTARAVVTVGDIEPSNLVTAVSADSIGQIRFAPLVLPIAGTSRVVGFARISVISSTALQKEDVVVAHQNATASLGRTGNISAEIWGDIFAASADYLDQFVLAPALQRTIP